MRDENGRIVNGSRISVFQAKYDKAVPQFYPPRNNLRASNHSSNLHKPIHYNPEKYKFRDTRSYSEATIPKTTNPIEKKAATQTKSHPQKIPTATDLLKPKHHTYPYEEFISEPNIITPKPTPFRRMCSRALGADTENIRDSLGAIEEDGEYAAAMKGRKCGKIKEMLERSSIAITESSISYNLP